MKTKSMKRLLSVVMTFALLFSLVLPVSAEDQLGGATDKSVVTFEEADNSDVSVDLLADRAVQMGNIEAQAEYGDTEPVRVSIVLEEDSTIAAGYSTVDIAENEEAMAYRSELEDAQQAVTSDIETVTGEDLDVVWNLTLAANVISANVEYGQIEDILGVDGVADVVIETIYEPAVADTNLPNDPNMSTSSSQIGSTIAYQEGYTGAGTRIAVIDTGIDSDHQSFNAGAYEYSLRQNAAAAGMGYDEYIAGLNLLTVDELAAKLEKLNIKDIKGVTAEKLYQTSKNPFGFNYVDEDFDITHDNDSQGEHGSHVIGIAAANSYIPDANSESGYSAALKAVNTQGVAPDAQIIAMKVFGKGGGAYDSDYMAAIEDAIVLGCDSVNLSLGSSNPGMTYSSTEKYQSIMDTLTESDTVVTISAGNASSWSAYSKNLTRYLYDDGVSMDTVGSPGSYTNSLSVASVDNDGFTGAYLTVGDDMLFYTETSGFGNAAMTTIAGEQEYIMIDGSTAGNETEYFSKLAEVLKGKIAVCYRGSADFSEKANAGAGNGAIATIVCNNEPGTINMNLTGYEYSAPCVSVTQADAEKLLANAEERTLDGITYYVGKMTVSSDIGRVSYGSDYYTMSDFSSWGVPGSLTLKPEITAPGGNIYSVNGAIAGGTSYENMSGTSMAAPQVAGMSALVSQYIKDKGLDETTGLTIRALTQSLLMSTAEPLYEEASGQYYSILNQGAGLANVGNAVSATSYIMMNADATESYADGKVKAELGDDVKKNGTYNFSFTINSLSEEDETYALSADLFTQDLFPYYANEEGDVANYMDTWTTSLAYTAVWTVDGKTLKNADNLDGLDFNGDGLVNADDGQALLDFVTGAREKISNKGKADLSGNDKIDSYDAYLFFKYLSTGYAVVPAGKTVKVTVSLTLTDDQKAYLDTYYPTGAYVEGYVYADALTSEEGVMGTNHSIPVLAYYGNWTDSSMYDLTSWTEYYESMYEGTTTRLNYLGTDFSNYVTVKYAGDSSEYSYGGNPLFVEEYDESKNAFNAENGDSFAKAYLALIRNAADGRLTVKNLTTDTVEYEYSTGSKYGAFYSSNAAAWYNTSANFDLSSWMPAGKEGDTYEITLTMAPEYYLNDNGDINWDALGEGASLSIRFTIDNTAPAVTDVEGSILHVDDASALTVAANDNQNISGVLLFNAAGDELLWYALGSEAEDGKFAVDAELEDGVYLLQVYDYAMNCSTYRIFLNTEETSDVESISLSADSLTVVKNTTAALTATVLPDTLTDVGVTWSSSDDSIASVNENGIITGVAAGECTITATSKQDPTVSATCTVTVVAFDVTIYGALQDEDGNPLLFTWDMENDSTWKKYADLENDISSITLDWLDENAPLYQQNSSGYMYQVDPNTGETLAQTNSENVYGAAIWDMDFSFYTYANTGVPLVWGVHKNYFLSSYSPMENSFTSGYDWSYYLSNTGANKFVALAWGGVVPYDATTTYDVMCALDDAGYLWYLFVNSSTGDLERLGYEPTDLELSFPTYEDGQYCSMVFDENLENLYLSYFTGATNELYILSYNENDGIYESTLLGNVGDSVWPAALFMVADNDSGEGTFSATTVNTVAEDMQTTETNIAKEEISLPKANGGLNSVISTDTEETEHPVSLTGTESDGSTVTLNVTEDEVSTNGVVTISYDSKLLKLTDAKINGNYTSQVADSDNGTFTLGYVDLTGITDVATLTFEVLNCADTTISVEHKEVGEGSGETETFDVNLTHSYGEPEFSWDEDYNCTAIFTCANCGNKVTVKCDVTSETTESTCNEDGATVYTATVTFEGKTYSNTLTAAINAGGHTYGEPVFTWDADHNCTATFTCEKGDDTQVVKCDVTSTTKDGVRTYTATVTFNGKTYTTTTTEKIADAGTSGVKTGDSTPFILIAIALILSLGCCVVVAFRMRRRRS